MGKTLNHDGMICVDKVVCCIGNPNCGKTTVFNALTGARQAVGNWPGVTVEKKVGFYTYNGEQIQIVDLPGIYSLTPTSSSGEDERVARDYMMQNEAGVVINIIDASNLERNLYLTLQLLEMRVPVLVVLNMLDIAKQNRLAIDSKALSKALGCPVVEMVASRDRGVKDLKQAIADFLVNPTIPDELSDFESRVDDVHTKIENMFRDAGLDRPHWLSMQIMEDAYGIDEIVGPELAAKARPLVEQLDRDLDGDLDIAIADGRYRVLSQIVEKVVTRTGEVSRSLSESIDRVVLNRWLGIPIFLLVMYVMFLFTQNFGAAFIDFFDIVAGGVFVDGLGQLMSSMGLPDWLRVIVADGIGGGIQTVATFIPPIFFLFLFLAFLEDSGYMARAAFVMDRLMRFLGLPGKAFVPLIVGFGCNVPAIMATRTMDRASDRIITMAMAPFMSCGARMPVYVLFAAAFFPQNGQNVVFGLYLIGICIAVLTGFLVKTFLLPGQAMHFVMEIPPYHIPTMKNVMRRTWDRLYSFVTKAGQMIIIIVAVLQILNSWGTDGSFGNQDTDKSVLSSIGQTITPVLSPMGGHEDNWPAAVGVFTGILAKEAVVGSMNSLYNSMATQKNALESTPVEDADVAQWSLAEIFKEATNTTIDNLAALGESFGDPMGLHVDDMSDTEAAAQAQEVDVSSIVLMQSLFDGKLGAFSYLLLILLYTPCVATVGAIYREGGKSWAIFTVAWTTLLGYTVSTMVYRVGTFANDPIYAVTAIVLSVLSLAAVIFAMRRYVIINRGKGPKRIQIQRL